MIDSEHFDDVFWLPGSVPPDRLREGRTTLSGASANRQRRNSAHGNGNGGTAHASPADSDDDDVYQFHELLYSRAAGDEEGDEWEAGVKAQLALNEGGSKKRRGGRRASGAGDTSPLSSDAEAPAPKKKGRPRASTKRARESVGDTDEEEVRTAVYMNELTFSAPRDVAAAGRLLGVA